MIHTSHTVQKPRAGDEKRIMNHGLENAKKLGFQCRHGVDQLQELVLRHLGEGTAFAVKAAHAKATITAFRALHQYWAILRSVLAKAQQSKIGTTYITN